MNTKRLSHEAECLCNWCLEDKGVLSKATQEENCGRCNKPLVVKENNGNMCQTCLARVFK